MREGKKVQREGREKGKKGGRKGWEECRDMIFLFSQNGTAKYFDNKS